MLIDIIQDRAVPMQKRLWKLLAAAHDFQLCVNKNELFKWEEMRKRHEDSGYGDRFCSKIYSRINADNIENSSAASACANTPEQLFKKMWKTVVPEMEVLRPGWQEYLKNCLTPLYNGNTDPQSDSGNLYSWQKSEFDFSYPDWQIQEEQLLVYWIYTYFCGAVYDDEIFAKVKMAVVCTLFIHELNVETYLKNNRQFKLDDQIRICYQFSRELEHSDLNLNRFEELMSEKEIFSFENLLNLLMQIKNPVIMSTKSIGRPLMVFRLILIINIVLSLLCFQHMPEFYLFSFRACLKNHFNNLYSLIYGS